MAKWNPSQVTLKWRIKPLVFALSLSPFLYYLYGIFYGDLGANPAEAVIRASGDWGLRFLLISLAITPLRYVLSWGWLLRLRRMLGLFAFFYASLHATLYLWLDQYFDWAFIWEDILERPFITVGVVAVLILAALAITSPMFMLRKLGKHWSRLHRLVYAAGVLAVLHFFWMKSSKVDVTEPIIYAVLLALLLGYRVRRWMERRAGAGASTSTVFAKQG